MVSLINFFFMFSRLSFLFGTDVEEVALIIRLMQNLFYVELSQDQHVEGVDRFWLFKKEMDAIVDNCDEPL